MLGVRKSVLTEDELNDKKKEVSIVSQLKDLTGRLFGFLSVQKRMPNYVQPNGRNRTRWLTICLLCGKAYIADGSHMLHGNIISCGCLKDMKTSIRGSERKGIQREIEDLSKQTFGFLEVIERCENLGSRTAWLCRCLLCGAYTKVRSNHLKRGLVISDGCVKSKGELAVQNALMKAGVKFKKQYCFSGLKSDKGYFLYFDFGLIDKDGKLICLLEYQGEQHDNDKTGDFGRQQREVTDAMKIDYCLIHRITYFSIWYFQDFETAMQEVIDFYRKSTAVPSKQEIV